MFLPNQKQKYDYERRVRDDEHILYYTNSVYYWVDE